MAVSFMKNLTIILLFLIIITIISSNIYNKAEWTYYYYDDIAGFNIDRPTCAVEDFNGNIWFGAYKGPLKFDGENFTYYSVEDSLSRFQAFNTEDMTIDHNGIIWFGNFWGVYTYDGSEFNSFINDIIGQYTEILSMREDKDSSMWFGTGRFLAHLKEGQWEKYSDELPASTVWSILIDKNGNKWFATSQGAAKFDGTTWTYYNENDGLLSNNISVIYGDSKNNIWFGHRRGITQLAADGFIQYPDSIISQGSVLSYLADDIDEIAEDKDGALWFNTHNAGVLRYYNGQWQTVTSQDGLIHNNIGAIFIDSKGNRWFAGRTVGISKLTPGDLIFNDSNVDINEKSTVRTYPNPFNNIVNIVFNVPNNNHASITIFNLKGQKIAVFYVSETKIGRNVVQWDGKDLYNGTVRILTEQKFLQVFIL